MRIRLCIINCVYAVIVPLIVKFNVDLGCWKYYMNTYNPAHHMDIYAKLPFTRF